MNETTSVTDVACGWLINQEMKQQQQKGTMKTKVLRTHESHKAAQHPLGPRALLQPIFTLYLEGN